MFQKSDRVHGRLFVVSFKAGDKAVARQEFNLLKGRQIMPIVGVIYLATIGRFFWLDLFYGIGVAVGLPTLAVAIYAYIV